MMVAIFAALTLALAAGLAGAARLAVAAVLVGLALAIALFLFEVESPDYGFRLPWLQVARPAPRVRA